MVARWEKGQIFPRDEVVERIAAIFGVSTEELLSGHTGPRSTAKGQSESIEPELEALWSEVGTLNTQDREVLKSLLEAMLMRSRVKDAVNMGGTPGQWREHRAS